MGPDFEFFKTAYGITPQGNWEGKTILQRALDDATLAARFKLDPEAVHTKLVEGHSKLLEAAIHNARFLLDKLYVNDRLLRSWRDGQAKHNAYLEDYAGLILGLLALYQSDHNPEWYKMALILADEMVAHFADPAGGFFDTRDDHETLVVRPRDIQDSATPSGNALAAMALLQLATYGDRAKWRSVAEDMLGSVQNAFLRYPTSFAQWLMAADFAVGPTREVAILGEPEDDRTRSLLTTL